MSATMSANLSPEQGTMIMQIYCRQFQAARNGAESTVHERRLYTCAMRRQCVGERTHLVVVHRTRAESHSLERMFRVVRRVDVQSTMYSHLT